MNQKVISETMPKQVFNEFSQPIGFPLPGWRPPPKPPRDVMTGAFCRLEALNPERHASALFEANASGGDGKSWTYLPYGPFQSLSGYRSWMHASCLGDDPLFFAIIDLTNGKPAGVASYLRIAPESGSIEVGHIHYTPRLQRSPAGTEAMYLMMKQAFALGYRRYEWKCDALNAPSRSAAQRLGLSFEGVFRQAPFTRPANPTRRGTPRLTPSGPALNETFQAWLGSKHL